MNSPSTYRRAGAAACLVAAAALTVVSVVLQPAVDGDVAARLAAIEASGSRSVISITAFTLSQLPFVVGLLGVAHLLRERAPRISNVTATLGLLGGFGHAVFGGVAFVMVAMAQDVPNRAAHARVLDAVEQSPSALFMAMGLIGTVLSLVCMALGLWRARLGPRWVPAVLVAFVLVEFVGTSLTSWASSVSAVLFALSFAALAVTVWRSDPAAWALPNRVQTPELALP